MFFLNYIYLNGFFFMIQKHIWIFLNSKYIKLNHLTKYLISAWFSHKIHNKNTLLYVCLFVFNSKKQRKITKFKAHNCPGVNWNGLNFTFAKFYTVLWILYYWINSSPTARGSALGGAGFKPIQLFGLTVRNFT